MLVGVYICEQILENISHYLVKINTYSLKDPEINAVYIHNNVNVNSVHYSMKKKQSKNRLIFVLYSQNEMLYNSENEWKTVACNMSES